MTEQLKGKIAGVLAKLLIDARCIEAGIQEDNEDELVGQSLDAILTIIKENYVRLATDQSLPEVAYELCKGTQQDMLKAGWRKVEV